MKDYLRPRWTTPVLRVGIMKTILALRKVHMANGLVVQLMGAFVIATILLLAFVLYQRRQGVARGEFEPEDSAITRDG